MITNIYLRNCHRIFLMLGKEKIFEDFLYHKIKNQAKPSNENIVYYDIIFNKFFQKKYNKTTDNVFKESQIM